MVNLLWGKIKKCSTEKETPHVHKAGAQKEDPAFSFAKIPDSKPKIPDSKI